MELTRQAPYSVYNDGTGPYAMFTCESCGRDYRAQPVLVDTVKDTVAKSAFGGLLRNIPIVGNAAAEQVDNDRYRNTLTADELAKAWAEVKVNFAECQSCRRIVCIPDFDMASGFCREDSPRSEELLAQDAQQAGAAAAGFMSGIANAFGITDAMKAAAAQQAAAPTTPTTWGAPAPAAPAPAPAAPTTPTTWGAPAPAAPAPAPTAPTAPTTWGAPAPAAPAPTAPAPAAAASAAPPAAGAACSSCGGALAAGAKFCSGCGTPVPVKAFCTGCGNELAPGAKFCANCGQPVAG